MKTKNWFEVDRQGLKTLQAGKPKHYVLRELVQNAWDEDITVCRVSTDYLGNRSLCVITVEDDNPEGFRNLRDAFTLFGDTTKRRDVKKRGRFNLGEKQAIAICESAEIATTKGTVIFDKSGRKMSRTKRESGSIITLRLRMKRHEYEEMLEIAKNYLTPKGIKHTINDEEIPHKEPFSIAEETLPTQFEVDGQLRDTERKTVIHIHKQDVSYLYEMGLPVLEIDCPYSIDVQQKIPMSADRESVKPSYLRKVYAIVLNHTVDEIEDEKSSETWVRVGSSDKRVTGETMRKIVNKRFGDKVVVANPQDPVANDDALAQGYRVIRGGELSKEEWSNIKDHELIKSSTAVFGKSSATDVKNCDPTDGMKKVAELAKKIAKRFLRKDISVGFYKSNQVSEAASYGNGVLNFNVTKLGKRFFENPVSVESIDLIVHELGHEAGMHTEKEYHKLITRLAGELVMTALKEPRFYEEVDAI